jgi:PII-like signaling protein
MKLQGNAKMLRLYFGEDDQWQGRPLYQAIVERCRQLDIAGATVYRGIQGYGASTRIRRRHLLSFSSDAPILVQIIDTEENIKRLIPALDEMVSEGLIAMSDVEVIKYVHQEGSHPQQ